MPETPRRVAKTQAALDYARALHAGQSRHADGAPFIVHPREVAALLRRAGAPEHVVAAGVLHEVIEKTPAHASDLRRRFGARVTRLVLAVSEDQRICGYAARKAALRDQVAAAGEEALMLFAADKISKARELRLEATARPAASARDASPQRPSQRMRLAHYQRCLSLLQRQLPASPLVAQLHTELESLRALTRAF
jgi:(p)ppGpp synthase/HD superfamily hydrolase